MAQMNNAHLVMARTKSRVIANGTPHSRASDAVTLPTLVKRFFHIRPSVKTSSISSRRVGIFRIQSYKSSKNPSVELEDDE
uniref:Uncharacterized protein n=1 Tax=Romanomermis culicivorax TaxID=13658 RepID=A0A915HK51_ROMCU